VTFLERVVLNFTISGVQIVGPLLDAGQIKSMVEQFKQVITASVTRKRERAERTQTEDFDAEEGELLEEENEQEEEVFEQVHVHKFTDQFTFTSFTFHTTSTNIGQMTCMNFLTTCINLLTDLL